jgi:hypothetical protein
VILTQHADQEDQVTAETGGAVVEFIPKDNFADNVLVSTLRQLDILAGPGGDMA